MATIAILAVTAALCVFMFVVGVSVFECRSEMIRHIVGLVLMFVSFVCMLCVVKESYRLAREYDLITITGKTS